MKFLQLILLCLLVSCASAPTSTNELTLRKVIVPAVQQAYDLMQADKYESALPMLDALIGGDPVMLTPYEMATVLELRANAKINLEDYYGAKADLEAAYALDVFPPDRQAQLKSYIDRDFQKEQEEKDRNLLPLVRIPPVFPDECIAVAGSQPDQEGQRLVTVELSFDVTAEGSTENIMATNSTNECFNQSAVESVRRWKYSPQVKNGEPIVVKDVKVAISYRY